MIINRRIKREIWHNKIKYGAIFLLIVFGIAFIISMATAADSIINTVEEKKIENRVEDGEFTVFTPLTKEQIEYINEKNIVIEESFNVSYLLEDNSTLRIFKVKKKINLIALNVGKLPVKSNEIVMEENYAKEHNLNINDQIVLGENCYIICGIGSTPDYNLLLKTDADIGADPKQFGTAFVNEKAYNNIITDTKLAVDEEYTYSYLLSEKASDNELKDYLESIEIDPENEIDPYLKEIIDKIENQKKKILSAVNEMTDGQTSLSDSIDFLMLTLKNLNQDSGDLFSATKEMDAGADKLADGLTKLEKGIQNLIDKYLTFEYKNLYSFIKNKDNARINDYIYDAEVNKQTAIFAGIIVFLLIAYIISIFVIHNIESENNIIGTLYSMGYLKKELVRHYMAVPVLISFLGGVFGTIAGFFLSRIQVVTNETYYSYPEIEFVYPVYLILFGIFMPVLLTLIVNYYTINKKLSIAPLILLKNNTSKYKIKRVILNENIPFIFKFQLRQLLREAKSYLTLFTGLTISIILLVLSFTMYGSINNLEKETLEDIKFNYMYLLKYPKENYNKNLDVAYTKTMQTQFSKTDSKINISLQGIDTSNSYFDINVNNLKKNEIIISSAAKLKFGWKIGESIILTDKDSGDTYVLNIVGKTQYSNGIFVFMNRGEMCKLFNQETDYYNTIFSNTKLDIENGRVLTVTTADEIKNISKIFKKLMSGTILSILGVSIIIFLVIMYLLLKLMIDKSEYSISLIKVFGFKNIEIRKMYLKNNLYTVVVSAIIGIPLGRVIVTKIHPYLVANISVGYNLTLPIYYYIINVSSI